MELLAPAGSLENFQAAVEAGADAVYAGAPDFNARNAAKAVRMDEIGAMIRHCRENGLKFYLAANSLIREQDLSMVIDHLSALDYLQPDALIIQDPGLLHLVKTWFPDLPVHASTLMGAHNANAVNFFHQSGFDRVVLARELTLAEISAISGRTNCELEVFVHGAMCFAYSGLCLFSSFLGGKSGLRGKCVQPCRRRYSWQKNTRGKRGSGQGGKAGGSYLFSMNDLSAIDAVPALRKAGVVSLKIEGRLRSTRYVENIVKAYRIVLDADPEDFKAALEDAGQYVDKALSRKTSDGYFQSPQPATAITPFHSGNIGLYLGPVQQVQRSKTGFTATLQLKHGLATGDRVRIHQESTGDRFPFTVKQLKIDGKDNSQVTSGQRVSIDLPSGLKPRGKERLQLYKVDSKSAKTRGKALFSPGKVRSELEKHLKSNRGHLENIKMQEGVGQPASIAAKAEPPAVKGKKPQKKRRTQRTTRHPGKEKKISIPLEWWLKIDNPDLFRHRLPFYPDRFVLSCDAKMIRQEGQLKRFLGKAVKKTIWSLPPVILEADLPQMQKNISRLVRSGYRNFQLAHLSQLVLFSRENMRTGKGAPPTLYLHGDYHLNLLNSQAVLMASRLGLSTGQLSIEADKHCLEEIFATNRQRFMEKNSGRGTSFNPMPLGLTVYGRPALFTARIDAGHFNYNQKFVSPKDERFSLQKRNKSVVALPDRPFSLLPYLGELKQMGMDYVVIDLTSMPSGRKDLELLAGLMAGQGKNVRLPTFNYLGTLE